MSVLHVACQHAGCRLAVRDDAYVGVARWFLRPPRVGRVVLARSLRRQGLVHEYVVQRGKGSGSAGGRRRALHDPIGLTIVVGDVGIEVQRIPVPESCRQIATFAPLAPHCRSEYGHTSCFERLYRRSTGDSATRSE